MSDKMIKKPLTLALGTAFVLGTASSVFAANDLLRGYEAGSADRMQLLAGGHGGEKKDDKDHGEGKCGEGKCGESLASQLLAGGHGGGDKKDKKDKDEEESGDERLLLAGGHGGEKKDDKEGGEGKCGENKCGENKCGAA